MVGYVSSLESIRFISIFPTNLSWFSMFTFFKAQFLPFHLPRRINPGFQQRDRFKKQFHLPNIIFKGPMLVFGVIIYMKPAQTMHSDKGKPKPLKKTMHSSRVSEEKRHTSFPFQNHMGFHNSPGSCHEIDNRCWDFSAVVSQCFAGKLRFLGEKNKEARRKVVFFFLKWGHAIVV